MDLSTLATRNYTYLPNGLVSQIAETAGGQTRTAKRAYDSFDRLVRSRKGAVGRGQDVFC